MADAMISRSGLVYSLADNRIQAKRKTIRIVYPHAFSPRPQLFSLAFDYVQRLALGYDPRLDGPRSLIRGHRGAESVYCLLKFGLVVVLHLRPPRLGYRADSHSTRRNFGRCAHDRRPTRPSLADKYHTAQDPPIPVSRRPLSSALMCLPRAEITAPYGADEISIAARWRAGLSLRGSD